MQSETFFSRLVLTAQRTLASCARNKHVVTGFILASHLSCLPFCQEIELMYLERQIVLHDIGPFELLDCLQELFRDVIAHIRADHAANGIENVHSNIGIFASHHAAFDDFQRDALGRLQTVSEHGDTSDPALCDALLDVINGACDFNEKFQTETRFPFVFEMSHAINQGHSYSVVYALCVSWLYCASDERCQSHPLIESIQTLVSLSLDAALV